MLSTKGIAIAEETEASMDQVMKEAEASTKRMVDMAQALQAEVSASSQIDENIAHVAGIVDNNSHLRRRPPLSAKKNSPRRYILCYS